MKKKLYVSLLVSSMIFALTACGGSGKATETTGGETTVAETSAEETTTVAETTIGGDADFTWPFGKIGKMLPKFEGKPGELSWEDNTGLSMYLYDISKSEFTDYAEKCQEAGFDVDYSIHDTSYSARNAEGYDLFMTYTESDKELGISVAAPADVSESETEATTEAKVSESETTVVETTAEETKATVASGDIRPEIKEAIDSYEAFFDEYCEFMKKYNSSSNQSSMLSDYTKYMTQCAETLNKLEAFEDADLSDAEWAYFNDAMLRIYNKLSEAGVM